MLHSRKWLIANILQRTVTPQSLQPRLQWLPKSLQTNSKQLSHLLQPRKNDFYSNHSLGHNDRLVPNALINIFSLSLSAKWKLYLDRGTRVLQESSAAMIQAVPSDQVNVLGITSSQTTTASQL